MTPQVSKGLRRLLPWAFVLGLQMWVLIAFVTFEGLIAFQEWVYRRGTERMEIPRTLGARLFSKPKTSIVIGSRPRILDQN